MNFVSLKTLCAAIYAILPEPDFAAGSMAERWQGHRRPRPGPRRSRSSTMDLAPLAAAGAKLVQSGATIMMHHGALSVAFAGALPRDMSLTIVTNSLLVATALEGHRQA
ncbi:MAG: hypothetical protein E5X92_14535, partial [Mesorhizobium sp.]